MNLRDEGGVVLDDMAEQCLLEGHVSHELEIERMQLLAHKQAYLALLLCQSGLGLVRVTV